MPPEAVTSVPAVADVRRFWGFGGEDLVFFAACYAAGVVFFLVMLT